MKKTTKNTAPQLKDYKSNTYMDGDMEIRFAIGPEETKQLDTQKLAENFLVKELMTADKIKLVYSHYDRVIIGGTKPVNKAVTLPNHPELRAEFFLERRELGIINVGGTGTVTADGKKYKVEQLSCLYLGKGTKNVSFASASKKNPALFYLLSAPAHATYPTALFTKEQASPVDLGAAETANKRTVYKYIHLDGIRSCQLVMGLTVMAPGSVWNSIPPHTHTRRMEVYFYFGMGANDRVFHFMGEPDNSRSIVMANDEAVMSPPWSIHMGAGTAAYTFIWAMGGENLDYTDMNQLDICQLK